MTITDIMNKKPLTADELEQAKVRDAKIRNMAASLVAQGIPFKVVKLDQGDTDTLLQAKESAQAKHQQQ